MPWDSLDRDSIMYFVRHTGAATWVVDADGYAVSLPEWGRITGQREEEIRGNGWMAALHPDDRDRVNAAWQTAVDHGSPYNTDYRVRCADGIYRWFNARGIQLLDDAGTPGRWIGLVLPIAGHSRLRSTAPDAAPRAATAIAPAVLRAARAMLALSAEELADAAAVSRSTIQRLEQDDAPGSARPAIIARVLDVLRERGVRLIVDGDTAVGVQLAP